MKKPANFTPELIASLALDFDISAKQAEQILESFFFTTQKLMKGGVNLELPGVNLKLGAVNPEARQARMRDQKAALSALKSGDKLNPPFRGRVFGLYHQDNNQKQTNNNENSTGTNNLP